MQGESEDNAYSYHFRDICCSKVVQDYNQPSKVQGAKGLTVLTNQVLKN